MRVLKSVRYKKQRHLDQGTKKVDFWLPVVLEKLKAQNLIKRKYVLFRLTRALSGTHDILANFQAIFDLELQMHKIETSRQNIGSNFKKEYCATVLNLQKNREFSVRDLQIRAMKNS